MKRQFTGRHMVLTLVAFFGVVMAVNFAMARIAVGGFSGTVVKNSYIASQNYNDWIDNAKAQADRGWGASVALDGEAHVLVDVQGLEAESLDVVAESPLRRSDDLPLLMERLPDGRFRSTQSLPAGRWTIRSIVTGRDGTGRFLHDLRV